MNAPAAAPQPQRRRALRWGLGGAAAALAGGAGLVVGAGGWPLAAHSYRGPLAPRAGALTLQAGGRAPVAWVFSSGGPRGFAHVGVVQALAQLGCTPDLVVGASIGSLVGTLVASGMSAERLTQVALDVGVLDVVRLDLQPRTPGWLSTAGLVPWLHALLNAPDLVAQRVPCAVVAADHATAQPVAFTHGDAGVAVQAACAVQGQFAPVRINEQRYSDADLVAPLPVRIARALGAQRVLAVDVSAHEDKAPAGTERWRESDLRKRALTRPDAQAADVLLHPDIGYYAGFARDWRMQAMATARTHALAQASALRALHA